MDKKTKRLRDGLCPYCTKEMVMCQLFDGAWRHTCICPDLHYGIVYFVEFDDVIPLSPDPGQWTSVEKIKVTTALSGLAAKHLDFAGNPIPIPAEHIRGL